MSLLEEGIYRISTTLPSVLRGTGEVSFFGSFCLLSIVACVFGNIGMEMSALF